MKSNRSVMIAASFAILTGVGVGYWWGRSRDHAITTGETAQAPAAPQALYWYDPMAPDQHFDKPGKSPFMDMPLIPKYAEDVAAGSVRVDPRVQQNVGLRTAIVEVGAIGLSLRTSGTLNWDLRNERVVAMPVQGIVQRVFVRAPFESVKRGQALASVLAPEWNTAIAEADAVGAGRSEAARDLRNAARLRLRALGVPGRKASDGTIALHSPQSGVVSEVLAREGQTALAGMPLFRVNTLETLWLEAALPQADVAGIRPGARVQATVDAVPGKTFEGKVESVLPEVEAGSRTQRARIVLRNDDGELSPGMFAAVSLDNAAGSRMPLVPTEAVIATGEDSRVILVDASGGFRPVRVRVGRSGSGRTEILAGLAGGERVVTSGQFLIDSEASLSGALQRLEPPAAAATTRAPLP